MSGYLQFGARHPALSKIAAALNDAGDSFHNTMEWQERCSLNPGGKSYCDLVQEAFDAADAELAEIQAEIDGGAHDSANYPDTRTTLCNSHRCDSCGHEFTGEGWPLCPKCNSAHVSKLKALTSPSMVRESEPVKLDQTEFGELGNCQSACLAMLLGLPLSEVPNWTAMPCSDNHFKQWGEHNALGKRVGKKAAGHLLAGVEHRAFPIHCDSGTTVPNERSDAVPPKRNII